VACAAFASRNSVLSSFRMWRLFVFSHSQSKRHVPSSDSASALLLTGRELLSSMTASRSSRFRSLPRTLQLALMWLSQRDSKILRQPLPSGSSDRESRDCAGGSSSSGKEWSPLTVSQLFTPAASGAARATQPPDHPLEWHRPNFGAQTSINTGPTSSRYMHTSTSQTPQVREAQLQQMLDELYGTSESP
jgi:hypothetical protein